MGVIFIFPVFLASAGAQDNELVEKQYEQRIVEHFKSESRSPIPKRVAGTREMRQQICSAVKDPTTPKGGGSFYRGSLKVISENSFDDFLKEWKFWPETYQLAVWRDAEGPAWILFEHYESPWTKFVHNAMEHSPLVDGCFWYRGRCPARPKILSECKTVK